MMNSLLRHLLPRQTGRASAKEAWARVSPGADVLFLDFQGVLHPWATETYECLPHLYTVLDALPDLQLVVSSTWHHYAPRSTVLANIDPDYRDRFKDSLFIHVRSPMTREVLIRQFARHHRIRSFTVVDAHPRRFRKSCQWVFQIPANEGLNAHRARALIHFITHQHLRQSTPSPTLSRKEMPTC